MVGKRLVNTGGEADAAALDPLQNFETVTYTGNGSTQKITGYIRKGAAFNGSSSVISTDLNFANNAKSISLWFKISDTNVYGSVVSSNNNGTGDPLLASLNWHCLQFNSTGNVLTFSILTGNWERVSTTTNNFNVNTWYNVTVTNDASSIKIYINGNLENTTTLTGTILSQDIIEIGGNTNTGGTTPVYFNGLIDQVRIFSKALDSGEVGQLALETYADPKKSTTDYFGDGSAIALYELDEDALTPFKQAASFNGSSSYISGLPTIENVSGQFSISLWFNTTVNPSVQHTMLGGIKEQGSNDSVFALKMTSDGYSKLYVRGTDGTLHILADTVDATDGNWHHLVGTISGSSAILYVDGAQVDSTTISNNITVDNLLIGAENNRATLNATNHFNGKIDQVRIYSSALDSTDVEKLYKESADVPTTDLVAHYKLDGNAEDALDTYDGAESNVTYTAGVYGGTPTNVNFLGMAFQPDFVWVKNRDASYSHMLYDSIRGAGNDLSSDTTSAEGTVTGLMTSFDTNGFTVVAAGSNRTNFSGEDYVAWCWKAGGSVTPNNNTDGDITSTVSANQDAGFSIVKYTGNLTDITTATGASVGHGLSSTPELIMFRNLSTVANWGVYSSELDNWGTNLHLNTTDAKDNQYSTYPIADPTQDIFYTNYLTAQNVSGYDYVAYCFHSVDGYQKVGSYTGSGVSGKRVYTTDDGTPTGNGGFRPRFVMYKLSSSSGHSWVMIDDVRSPSNPRNKYLFANESNQEGTSNVLNFTDNGFELLITYLGTNALDETYIYLAIA